MKQEINGIPVFGGEALVNINDNDILSFSGRYLPSDALDLLSLTPTVTATEANVFLANNVDIHGGIEPESAKLAILSKEMLGASGRSPPGK